MKIARWEPCREPNGLWRWEAIGIRGNVVLKSNILFSTIESCEADMFLSKRRFLMNERRVVSKPVKKDGFLKCLVEWFKKW